MNPNERYYELMVELRFSGARQANIDFVRRFKTKEDAEKACAFYLSAFSGCHSVKCLAFYRLVCKMAQL